MTHNPNPDFDTLDYMVVGFILALVGIFFGVVLWGLYLLVGVML